MNKLGSHNSWSYAKPKHWYTPSFIAKCQNVDIEAQYCLGVRFFDLRLKLYNLDWETAHGIVTFKTNWLRDLAWLNKQKDTTVRIILEYNSCPKNVNSVILRFQTLCEVLESNLKDITFCGGSCKWDGKTVYYFKNAVPPLISKYSSCTSLIGCKPLSKVDDWWPWLYAKTHNKKSYKQFFDHNNGEYLFIDFVDMVK